jgi:hypothetical protein
MMIPADPKVVPVPPMKPSPSKKQP